MTINFVGVKVGDINGNVSTNLDAGVVSETRSSDYIELQIDEQSLSAGKLATIEVKTNDFEDIRGLQLELDLGRLQVIEVQSGTMNVDNQYATKGGSFMLSFAHADGMEVQEDDVLFTLVAMPLVNGALSETVSVSNEHFSTEAYIGQTLEIVNVEVEWNTENTVESDFYVGNIAPNPWISEAQIEVHLPKAGTLGFRLLDAAGRVVKNTDLDLPQGRHFITVDQEDINSSGLYYYELRFGDKVERKKMIKVD